MKRYSGISSQAALASNWINLAANAKADVFICLAGSGGDGALDPIFGNIAIQFKP